MGCHTVTALKQQSRGVNVLHVISSGVITQFVENKCSMMEYTATMS